MGKSTKSSSFSFGHRWQPYYVPHQDRDIGNGSAASSSFSQQLRPPRERLRQNSNSVSSPVITSRLNESKRSIVTGSLFQRSASASTKTPTPAKANLLLKLPAKLRNKIYALALTDRGPDGKKVSSYKGLAGACKQIRAEFWPLFWHGAVLRITPNHLPSVPGTFFPYTFESPVHPANVIITVDQYVSCNHAYVNVPPILQAKPLCPQADWVFEVAKKNIWSWSYVQWRQIITEYYIISELRKNPAARLEVVLSAAQSGLLRALHCELFARDFDIKWHLLVRTDDGRLDNQGRADLEACCRELCRFDHRSVRHSSIIQDKKVTVSIGAEEKEVYLWGPKYRKLILSLDAAGDDDEEK